MPRKTQKDGTSEANALWSSQSTHAFLVLLEEHVRNNHRINPTNKDFKIMAEKLLRTCHRRYLPGQLKSKYHRLARVYNKYKKLVNHIGLCWDVENNMPLCSVEVWKHYYEVRCYSSAACSTCF